jgi:8-oxo-dGTP pyrophosphatase MutT (NUDIX family)
MLRRSPNASFLPGAYVFPGGVVDPEDASPDCLAAVDGLSDESAARQLGLEAGSGGLQFWVAAVRECFEESGLLLAVDRNGQSLSVAAAHDADFARRLESDRSHLLAGTRSFGDILIDCGATIDAQHIVPWSRWVTPIGGTRRFDTRFFVTAEPSVRATAELSFDEREMSDLRWFTPSEAIADDNVSLVTPTSSALRLLGRYGSTEVAMGAARHRS